MIKEIVVDDDEYRADAKTQGRRVLRIANALIERVTALISLRDGPEDGEVRDLERLLLRLHHVSHAFSDAAPNHVEQAEGLPLLYLERVILLTLCISWLGLITCRVLDEL